MAAAVEVFVQLGGSGVVGLMWIIELCVRWGRGGRGESGVGVPARGVTQPNETACTGTWQRTYPSCRWSPFAVAVAA
jgi:hypothetical protein